MKPDLILFNGVIHTMDPAVPLVSSVAIRDGKVVAVGNDELLEQFSNAGKKIDLQHKVVIPGLVDAHAHLRWYAESLDNVDLMDTRNLDEIFERLQSYLKNHLVTDWIQGWGWNQEDWADKVFPTAAMIDQVITDIPVAVTSRSGHALWCNSLALARANINEATSNPPGGEIRRDGHGRPTGLLLDTAAELVESVIPPLPANILAGKMQKAMAMINEHGLTGFHDFDDVHSFKALQLLNEKGKLTLRVIKGIPVSALDDAIGMAIHSGFGDEFLRFGAVKIFADGALGPRTAATSFPYAGEPENYGIVVTSTEDMTHLASKASLSGLVCAIHAIGDQAVRNVLDAYQAVREVERKADISPETRPHRIEHVQLIDPKDAGRLGELGIIASMQPIHATSDMVMADEYWGEKAAYSYNWRLQLYNGAILAFGSDAPVESINPFLGMHAAVTRRRLDGSPGPNGWRSENHGRLTVQEAVHAYTVGPAIASGTEDHLGKLKPGYLADLLVLNQDIFQVDPMEIPGTKPLAVMLGGEWIINNL